MLHARLLVAIALAAALLAACGGADEAPSPVPGTSTPATTATATSIGEPTAEPTATAEGTATATSSPVVTPSETVASTYFVPTAELPVVRFTTSDGRTVDLPTEVPPASEYSIGLSGRESLDGRGMLFYYPGESGGPGFWMRNTHIDLDIAFVAGDLTVIAIYQMRAETEDIHHPGRAYLAGIEAPAGWYAAHGIEAGDRVEFLFEPEDYLE